MRDRLLGVDAAARRLRRGDQRAPRGGAAPVPAHGGGRRAVRCDPGDRGRAAGRGRDLSRRRRVRRRPASGRRCASPRRRKMPRGAISRSTACSRIRSTGGCSTSSAAGGTSKRRIVRAIGDPRRRFAEDRLRLAARGALRRAARLRDRAGDGRGDPRDGPGDPRGVGRAHRRGSREDAHRGRGAPRLRARLGARAAAARSSPRSRTCGAWSRARTFTPKATCSRTRCSRSARSTRSLVARRDAGARGSSPRRRQARVRRQQGRQDHVLRPLRTRRRDGGSDLSPPAALERGERARARGWSRITCGC